MKKLILIASLFIVSQATIAQTVHQDKNGNYVAAKRDTASKPTGKTFTDASGKVYPVYVSRNGKLYYMRTSKSGNIYKAYLKVS